MFRSMCAQRANAQKRFVNQLCLPMCRCFDYATEYYQPMSSHSLYDSLEYTLNKETIGFDPRH